ncbi:lipoyl(octanoyl) transferase LipB [Buchananella hordeovulneris]|uniref:Octanoyltransferase n=1 Tax=Buchananella hordeovulneris TaxID=52770 RepID=A0A1Q5PY25_9ACTO|nr:lipoyl(octanoyl) transferase LipB [Buchananella hordeovulneris]MDO5081174.1 lipoyl(octanoyl) transferase LipB [Buchananella hordeovulneris]OKL52290.1 lipoate-protein ligase B [Buchananella hordeovulneris]
MHVETLDLGKRLVDYHEAWQRQRQVHAAVVAGHHPDTLLLVEHPSVYTAGRRTAHYDRPTDGTEVIDVDRGGRITWHGPGQLVVYPIIKLRPPLDVVAYVRALEAAVIEVCTQLGVPTDRVADRTGVWVKADERGRDRKVCAIGVRTARHVTMHGIALNCNPDLSRFGLIVPCGISDADVTSLSQELARNVPIAEVVEPVTEALQRHLTPLTAAFAQPEISKETS